MKKPELTNKKLFILLGIFSGLALLSFAVYKITENFPEFTTEYYSHGLYSIITLPGKAIAGIFPFSIGEIMLLLLLFFLAFAFIHTTVQTIIHVLKKHSAPWQPAFRFVSLIIILAELALTIFIWSGGLNYNGVTMAQQMAFEDRDYSAQELYDMTVDYIEKADSLRKKLPETPGGNLANEYSFSEICRIALDAYENIPDEYNKTLAQGYFTKAKPGILSTWMCYTNITGIYPYLSPEPIINTKIPATSLPTTICHEMAHQRAIAREDEANYISFIACTTSGNEYFEYSGYYMAVINCLNSLYSVNYQLWVEAWQHMSSEMVEDISASQKFWQQYETPVGEISEKVNDTYLQANNIKDGAASYGRLTDLLLADFYN